MPLLLALPLSLSPLPPWELRLTMHNRISGSVRVSFQWPRLCTYNEMFSVCSYKITSHFAKNPSMIWQHLALRSCLNLNSASCVSYTEHQTLNISIKACKNIPDLHLMMSLNSSLVPPSATSPCDAMEANKLQCFASAEILWYGTSPLSAPAREK